MGALVLAKFRKVCELSEVPAGTMRPIDLNGFRIMVVNVDGELFAVDRVCTHETADLSTGFLLQSEVTCPLHLSRFDVKTGAVQNPPATRPLRTYKLRLDGTGVYVQI